MDIKAAIFDMDGTLIDSLIFWDFLWSSFGERFLNDRSFRPGTEDDKKVRTLILADAMELIHNNYGLGNSGEELLQLANSALDDFYANRVEMKSGAREFLDYCLDHGTKMCIASATASEFIDVAVKRCDIGKYFLKIFSCGSIGKGKEEPDIFLQAREFLGTEVKDTWVFEDSLVAIKTAAAIGMPIVGIYDANNFGQDEIKEIATEYINDGESLLKLIP